MRLPNDTERHAIYGMTGSGKTHFALYCLSFRSFDRMPWIIIDFKRDPLIAEIPGLTEIHIDDKLPKRSGLYVVRPEPSDVDSGAITAWLYRVWKQERIGLYLDEGYMIRKLDPGLRTVLTQGRSKRLPMIILSQRPAWVCPFIQSESEFKSIFYLQNPADVQRVSEWLPPQSGIDIPSLPKRHSYWYSVADRDLKLFGPCPGETEIMQRFDARRPRHFRL